MTAPFGQAALHNPKRPTILALLLALSLGAGAHQSPPVSIQVFVSGPGGQPIEGLTAADFQLSIDRQRVPVVSAASAPQVATDFLVLLDVSASVDFTLGQGSSAKALLSSVHAWMAMMPGSVDRWRLGIVAKRIALGPAFTSDREELQRSADALLTLAEGERYGPSPIWDAVDAGVSAFESRTGKKAIVLLSDGRTTGNRIGLAAVTRRALAARIPVTVICTGAGLMFQLERNQVLMVDPGVALEQLARETGGRYITDPPVQFQPDKQRLAQAPGEAGGQSIAPWLTNVSKLGTILNQLQIEVGHSYVITFEPPAADGRRHEIDVRVTKPGATVRTQRVYVAPAGSTATATAATAR
jgi:hypothetical protein